MSSFCQFVIGDSLEKTALMNVPTHVMTVMMSLVCVSMDASQDGQDTSVMKVILILAMST